ncbi:hypothetical protein ACFV24_33480 [Nocardia fluminea]|uniref:hypothetical protein n=1 Tax=Nocardia fluminea TaxID=134984 RepID=UPI00366AFF1F
MNNNAAGRRLRELRPARRLVVIETVSAVVLGMVTLPFSYPGAGEPPILVQLLGLTFLMGAFVANLHMWRAGIVSELMPDHGGVSTAHRLRQRMADEQRLRRAAIMYPVAILVLVPLPTAWQWFWFILTIIATVVGVMSLWRTWQRARVVSGQAPDPRRR